jgi:hypothetical protein
MLEIKKMHGTSLWKEYKQKIKEFLFNNKKMKILEKINK